MPVYAILFGEVLGVLSKDVETARSDSIFYSFMFLVVGVVVGLAMFLQGNTQCSRTDLNKRFLPRPKTITA